jgi:hypothetical protein
VSAPRVRPRARSGATIKPGLTTEEPLRKATATGWSVATSAASSRTSSVCTAACGGLVSEAAARRINPESSTRSTAHHSAS